VFEFTGTELCKVDTGNQRKHHVCGKAFFKLFLDPESVRCVHNDASMLGRNDRLDDIGEAIDIGESLDAEYNVVEGWCASRDSIFGTWDDCRTLAS